jgi:hypothetical protein
MGLVKPAIGKGSLDTRITHALEEGKRVGTNLQPLNKEANGKLGFECTH